MALKDWKKVEDDGKGNSRIGWVRKNDKDFMVIFYPIRTGNAYFDTDFVARNKNNFNKSFKTKSDALAYAKSYMRTH